MQNRGMTLTRWFVWQAEWTVNSLARCVTGRMMFNLVHMGTQCGNAFWNVLPSVHFLSLPESQNGGMFLARITGIMPGNYSPCQNRRIARMFWNKNSLTCQSKLPFCGDKIHPKPYTGLPQASHEILLNLGVYSQYGVPMPPHVLLLLSLSIVRNPPDIYESPVVRHLNQPGSSIYINMNDEHLGK